jgi:hypothetical protein
MKTPAAAFDKGLPRIGDSAREEHYYTAGLGACLQGAARV